MKIVFTMPAYNEEGINDFIQEIYEALINYDLWVIVVNDNSNTSMGDGLTALKQKITQIEVIKNATNLGHGPSTIIGLKKSLEYSPDLVIALDGDGQFLIEEIQTCVLKMQSAHVDIIEGCRTRRTDPRYRQISSFLVKALVKSACGSTPRDANTPLRIYNPNTLSEILKNIDPNLNTPNLFISAFSRIRNYRILEIDVTSVDRRGNSRIGTSWNKGITWLPSKKFLKFCLKSTMQWYTTIIPILRQCRT